MKNNKLLWVAIIVVIVVVVAWAAMKGKHEHPGTPMNQEQGQQEHPAGSPGTAPGGEHEHPAGSPGGAEHPNN